MGNSTSLIEPNLAQQEAAIRFLLDRIDYERSGAIPYDPHRLGLDRMEELLDRLGRPDRGLPVVHVAGTKGKGSTSAMIAAALSAAGLRTGLYTSPHLEGVEERMRIDGHPCDPGELVDLIDLVRPAVEDMDQFSGRACPPCTGPTYFEITTAMALLHFARQEAQAAVLEVGLGGRLDATNVCTPQVSVITSISFDHTQQLGDTLASIAREKAGIIKPGVPVVSGVTDEEPREVIRQICRERGCRLIERGSDFDFDYEPPRHLERADARGLVRLRTKGGAAGGGALIVPSGRRDLRTSGTPGGAREFSLALPGRHQAANAAVAVAALDELGRAGWKVHEAAIRTALAELRWPARIEVVARRPAVVLDAAHNVASIEALVETLSQCFAARRRILIFAASRDKDHRGMLQRLVGRFDDILLTRYLDNPRAAPPEELEAVA
ncbi:MAG: folylpolyglutamate synthase/dihydrofolate synthase family protein, partial [Thermoguttaceae bacterium]